MNGELEQVSRCLDEALISFSAGEVEETHRHLMEATAILDAVLASTVPAEIGEVEVLEPMQLAAAA